MLAVIRTIVGAIFAELLAAIFKPPATTVEDADPSLDSIDPAPKAERDSDLVDRAPVEWLR